MKTSAYETDTKRILIDGCETDARRGAKEMKEGEKLNDRFIL